MSDIDDVRESALPLEYEDDLDPLLERIGDARCVLLGEASHGTHEYYAWRSALTRRLITERGFSFVAVEGDWPDCWDVNTCVTRAPGAPSDPKGVLDAYRRWPTWLWANQETVNFARWLYDHNDPARLGGSAPVGFYGLDVFSLWESLRAVLTYLTDNRPDQVEYALEAYRCFEPFGEDPRAYAHGLVPDGCAEEVLALLIRLRRPVGADTAGDLNARQNAAVVAKAEEYYRTMLDGGPRAWNVRETHMADTLDRLLAHHGPGSRAVVWAHNSHVGDARATTMALAGMVSLGQLVRERHGRDRVVCVGFAGGCGEVVAAGRWGAPWEIMNIPAPPRGSSEELMIESGVEHGLFVFADRPRASWLTANRGHRSVGVVYDPTRDDCHLVPTRLADRYDALCWFRRTSPLEPLHRQEGIRRDELETVPSGA